MLHCVFKYEFVIKDSEKWPNHYFFKEKNATKIVVLMMRMIFFLASDVKTLFQIMTQHAIYCFVGYRKLGW